MLKCFATLALLSILDAACRAALYPTDECVDEHFLPPGNSIRDENALTQECADETSLLQGSLRRDPSSLTQEEEEMLVSIKKEQVGTTSAGSAVPSPALKGGTDAMERTSTSAAEKEELPLENAAAGLPASVSVLEAGRPGQLSNVTLATNISEADMFYDKSVDVEDDVVNAVRDGDLEVEADLVLDDANNADKSSRRHHIVAYRHRYHSSIGTIVGCVIGGLVLCCCICVVLYLAASHGAKTVTVVDEDPPRSKS